MAIIGMNKPAGKKPVPLAMLCNCRRIKYQVVNDLAVAEPA
jgi:hypothetical protein